MPKTKSEMVVKSRRKRRMLDLALERLTLVCREVDATGDTPVITRIDRRNGITLHWQFHPTVYEVMKESAKDMGLSVDGFIEAVMKSRHCVEKRRALALTASPGKMN